MPTAIKASMSNASVKLMVWGDSGSGKSRFALSSPSPLVIDLEDSTRLYSNEFDFLVANTDKTNPAIDTSVRLTAVILKEIAAGQYPEAKTLVIDPITDLLDNLESICTIEYEKKIGKSVSELNQLQKTKWYSFRRDKSRNLLNQLKDLPMNIILVARTKNVWGKDNEGKMAPIGQTYDALDIVEYLMDVVIHLQKNKKNDIQAIVKKSRLGNLPDVLEVKDYSSIVSAIKAANTEPHDKVTGELPPIKPTSTPSNNANSKKITPPQVARLYALANGDEAMVKRIIKKNGEYESANDILKTDYPSICEFVELEVDSIKNPFEGGK